MRISAKDLKVLESQGRITLPPRPSKYRAKPAVIDGVRFDSQVEARRWCTLQLLEKAGVISDLRRQIPFHFMVDGSPVFKWIADHVYREKGETVVEDVKGFPTKEYKLKKKLIEAQHKIKIIEVKK